MNKFKLLLFFLVAFVIYFILSIPYFSGDVKNHIVWGKSILDLGPYEFYSRYFHDYAFPNYPPVAMLLFAMSFKLYQLFYQLIWFLNNAIPFFPSNFIIFSESLNMKAAFLKIPSLLSTITLSFLIFKIGLLIKPVIKKKYLFLLCISFLINPAIFYLSVVWGQIDLLPVLFLLLAFYFIYKKQNITSAILMAMALLSKQTIIIFWPVLLIYAFKIFTLKKTLINFLVTLITVFIFYVPFLGFSPLELLNLYTSNFSYVAQVTEVNAINIWGYLFDFHPTEDSRLIFNLTYQQVGYLLFLGLILPVVVALLIKKFKIEKNNYFYLVAYGFFLISIFYFIVLTRMHERYLIASVVFSYILVLFKKFHIFNLIFFSFLVFLNLYRGLEMPNIMWLRKLLFNRDFLDILFIIFGSIALYNLVLFYRSLKRTD